MFGSQARKRKLHEKLCQSCGAKLVISPETGVEICSACGFVASQAAYETNEITPDMLEGGVIMGVRKRKDTSAPQLDVNELSVKNVTVGRTYNMKNHVLPAEEVIKAVLDSILEENKRAIEKHHLFSDILVPLLDEIWNCFFSIIFSKPKGLLKAFSKHGQRIYSVNPYPFVIMPMIMLAIESLKLPLIEFDVVEMYKSCVLPLVNWSSFISDRLQNQLSSQILDQLRAPIYTSTRVLRMQTKRLYSFLVNNKPGLKTRLWYVTEDENEKKVRLLLVIARVLFRIRCILPFIDALWPFIVLMTHLMYFNQHQLHVSVSQIIFSSLRFLPGWFEKCLNPKLSSFEPENELDKAQPRDKREQKISKILGKAQNDLCLVFLGKLVPFSNESLDVLVKRDQVDDYLNFLNVSLLYDVKLDDSMKTFLDPGSNNRVSKFIQKFPRQETLAKNIPSFLHEAEITEEEAVKFLKMVNIPDNLFLMILNSSLFLEQLKQRVQKKSEENLFLMNLFGVLFDLPPTKFELVSSGRIRVGRSGIKSMEAANAAASLQTLFVQSCSRR